MMKKMYRVFSFLLMSSLLVSLLSCSEDEATGGDENSPNQIIGKWTLESADIVLTVEGKPFWQFYKEAKGVSEQEAKEAEEYWKASDIKSEGTLEFKANNQYQMSEPGKAPITGSWELSDDEKELFLDGKSYDIQSFSKNQMTIYTTLSYKFDFDNNGTQDKVLNEITQHLKK